MQDQYIPGACNIGKSEIERRKRAGWIGLIAAIILYALFVYYDVTRIWRLIIFIPATAAAIGFLQARMHFCAYFGMVGVFNFGSEVGKTDTVEQAEFRAADRRKAWQIIIYSVFIGAVTVVVVYYLPP
ncbi:Uncharacterised protein [uncultured archaeon]|nr:Uncharacterised protein [uncultured archaeon]